MRTVVVYKSISGFTRKYAQWIAGDLNADLFDVKDISSDLLMKYDCIIYGGPLHASGISGVKKLTSWSVILKEKKIIVFATGASPSQKHIPEEILRANFTDDERTRIRFFYLRGGFDFGRLSIPFKIIMTLFKWKLLSRKEKTADERGMIDAYANPVDFCKKENLRELLDYSRKTI